MKTNTFHAGQQLPESGEPKALATIRKEPIIIHALDLSFLCTEEITLLN